MIRTKKNLLIIFAFLQRLVLEKEKDITQQVLFIIHVFSQTDLGCHSVELSLIVERGNNGFQYGENTG